MISQHDIRRARPFHNAFAMLNPWQQFDDDFYEFRCNTKELERRIGAVVSLAFDDCATVYGRFNLLDSFEGLLERPIIQVATMKREQTPECPSSIRDSRLKVDMVAFFLSYEKDYRIEFGIGSRFEF